MLMTNNNMTRRGGLFTSPYDPRNYNFKDLVPLGSTRIPESYMSPEFPFVYDQGNSSMCAACAYVALRYLQESDNSQSELNEPFSPTFQYGNRIPGEDFEGMYLSSVCSKGREGSVLKRDLFKFCSYNEAKALVNARKAELMAKAKPFAISSYYVCHSREEIQSAIMRTKGVLIGIPITNCYYNVKRDGIVRYDKNKDVRSFGGHAQLVTGWKYIDGVLYWRVLNSWGRSWGDNGYCWLPESYPWIDQAYAVVDNVMELKIRDYVNKFYG